MDRVSIAEWKRTSWVESANDPACGFPLQSLPYCIFVRNDDQPRPGVGIGAFVFDLYQCSRSGMLKDLPASIRAACEAPTLNPLISCGTGSARSPPQLPHGPAGLWRGGTNPPLQSVPLSCPCATPHC